jgi:hypothetical protein
MKRSAPLFTVKSLLLAAEAPVVFFACPLGTKVWKVRWAIKSLTEAGYSVVAYEFTEEIFTGAEPEKLHQLVSEVCRDIQKKIVALKISGTSDFGFFGSSLGAFIMYNCIAAIPELRWGVLNTAGDAAHAVFTKRKLRRSHSKAGYTQDELRELWGPMQFPRFRDLDGLKILLVSSNKDRLLPLSEVDIYMEPLRTAGAEVDIMELNVYGHMPSVVVGLRRAVPLLAMARGEGDAGAVTDLRDDEI